MQKAAIFLRGTHQTIETIAGLVGFQEPAFFQDFQSGEWFASRGLSQADQAAGLMGSGKIPPYVTVT